jgi:hypothetical protein
MEGVAATRVGGSRAALAGLLFGLLYVVGVVVVGRIPGPNATELHVESSYGSSNERLLVVVVGAT